MLRHAALAACALSLAAPTAALAGWSTPESLSGGHPSTLALAPGGTGLVVGFPANQQLQIAERPPGGPVGVAKPLSGTIGKNDIPIIALDGAGNALIASHDDRQIAYRPAGG